MNDVVFILLTLAAFALMALLLGVLDRRVGDQRPDGGR